MTRPRRVLARLATVMSPVFVFAAAACAPRVGPLRGVTPKVAHLPPLALADSPLRVTFTWELNSNEMVVRGDGVARIAPPDSARVDLFLGGGFGRAAAAVLVGDSLRLPPGAGDVGGMIPPAPLMWAAFGRLAVPPVRDTTVRVAGDTVRAELANPGRWRLMVVGGRLRRLERISGTRIVEFVDRNPGHEVRYELSGRRSLVLHIEHEQQAPPFDASVWTF